MNVSKPLMEIVSLIISLALAGLILREAKAVETVLGASSKAFASLIEAATMQGSNPVAGVSPSVSRYR